MIFRADIQILRGLSVLLVVLFHLGFDYFKSGFLGVDVFFIISGFLMAVLYNPEDKLHFFKRRALRLLPAYYIVIIFTLIASFIFSTRNETVQVVEQSLFASTFASNFGFWMHNSYFSGSNFNPLLHLWSLAVEIQFYLLVPLIALFFRKSKLFLVAFIIISLSLCFTVTTISPKTSFFITPFRVWEFLIGYGVAIFFTNKGNIATTHKSFLGAFGLIILLTIPLLPVGGDTLSFVYGHPGMFALAIAAATALVLAYGIPRQIEQSKIGKGLSILGKYSYSIYLVHFPIIVIYNNEPFGGTNYGTESFLDLLILVSLISAASFLLHNFVERKNLPNKLAKNWRTSVAAASLFIVFMSSAFNYSQIRLLSEQDQYIFSAERDRSVYRCGKLFRILNPSAQVCELTGLSDATGSIMLAGNSHADAIKETFREAALKNNLNLYFFVSNSTMNRGGRSPAFVIQQALEHDVSVIFVHQSANSFSYEALNSLVSQAETHDIKMVYLEPVPVWEESIPKAMWLIASEGSDDAMLRKNIDDYHSENGEILVHLSNINSDNFSRMSVGDIFCKPECSFRSDTGKPLYFDNNHLTRTGSQLLNAIVELNVSDFRHE